MNIKTVIQILLLLVIVISSVFFFNEYKKNNVSVKLEDKKTVSSEFDAQTSEDEFNLLKNIRYISKDASGNIYEIYAEEGRVNSSQPDLTLMKNVKAYIFFGENDIIEIIAKYATYNNLNYNTLFREDIAVKYFAHKINCEKLDISFDKSLASFYEDLVYESENMKMNADKLEIDLITKNSKIIMFDSEEKISIVSKN